MWSRALRLCVPSAPDPYELALTSAARRSIAHDLPESVAHAVVQLVTGALLLNPRRLGKPLQGHFSGVWVARRGSYRVLFHIDDDHRTVLILRIEHRRDIYR